VTVLRYSLLRLMLLLGVLVALWLLGGLWAPLRDPLLLVLATAVLSVVLSYFVLRGPREAMTQQIADRVSGRLAPAPADEDAAAEDAEAAGPVPPSAAKPSAERESEAQQQAVDELGAAGVAQHGDEPEAGHTTPHDAHRRPEQQG
jgi:hypothetical protein